LADDQGLLLAQLYDAKMAAYQARSGKKKTSGRFSAPSVHVYPRSTHIADILRTSRQLKAPPVPNSIQIVNRASLLEALVDR